MSEILTCNICGQPVAPSDFVGLVKIAPEQYVVGQIGCQVGDELSFDVYAHAACLTEKGERIGELHVGHG